MEKIKFVADTACDIPDELLARYDIAMPSVPITIGDTGYFERKSFSVREFYKVLANTKEIPATSRVPLADYLAIYEAAWKDGCTDIVNVTINAGGSGTHDSALMAIKVFYQENPEAEGQIKIHLIDSRSYSMGYGYAVVEGAKMAEAGKTAAEIIAYLEDFFSRVEIYLVCYTLEYAKKSGRISAAAAFVGDVLGMRPIIYLIDGETKVVEKVRGEKLIGPKMLDTFRTRCSAPDGPVFVISAAVDEYGDNLQELLQKELGREIPQYKAGASIVINAGPNIAAMCFLGKKRS